MFTGVGPPPPGSAKGTFDGVSEGNARLQVLCKDSTQPAGAFPILFWRLEKRLAGNIYL